MSSVIMFSSISGNGELIMASNETGFVIYSPGQHKVLQHSSSYGGLRFIYSIGTSPVYLIVPSGDKPGLDCSPRRPKFWNSQNHSVVKELILEATVEGCAWNKNYSIFVTDRFIHIFNIEFLKISCVLPKNSHSNAFALATDEGDLLFCAGQDQGSVCMYSCRDSPCRLINTFRAHRSAISCMAVDVTSGLLATVSSVGTIIRVFKVPSADLLYSIRIASIPCKITHLQFCSKSDFILSRSEDGCVCLSSIHHIKHAQVSAQKQLGFVCEDIDEDFCAVHTIPPPPTAQPTNSITDYFNSLLHSETANTIVDVGLYGMSRLYTHTHTFLTGKPTEGSGDGGGGGSSSAGSGAKMYHDGKLYRPVLEEVMEDMSCVWVGYKDDHITPYLAVMMKTGVYRR
ncbi:hypothetical protein EON65_30150 [archaeon]|nr:MAG: hypothetical protein EON65_30150 [archaeon]